DALAAPFATLNQALAVATASGRSISAAGYATNDLDGAIIYMSAGAHTGLGSGPTTSRPQRCAAVIVTRDPVTTDSAADVEITQNGNWRPRMGAASPNMDVPTYTGAIILREVTWKR